MTRFRRKINRKKERKIEEDEIRREDKLRMYSKKKRQRKGGEEGILFI